MAGLMMPWTAGMLQNGYKPPLSYTFNTSASNSATSNTFTFSSQSIGTAPSAGQRRFVFVLVGTTNQGSVNPVPINVTIGGVSATQVVKHEEDQGSYADVSAIFYAEIPSGTTATIVVTHPNGGGFRCGIGVYAVYSGSTGINIGSTYTDIVDPLDANITAQEGNLILGVASSTNAGSFNLPSGQNFTENFDIAKGDSNDRVNGASGILTVDVTNSLYRFDLTSSGNAESAVWAVITN